MDDPLSRALREEEQGDLNFDQNSQPAASDLNNSDLSEQVSSLSISHSHNEWMLPATNQNKEESEIGCEKTTVFVGDPKKHKSNLDSFITYLVTTKTFNDGVKINESNVRRRYNDFVWLKNVLDAKYPYNIIAPLPAKHTFSKKLHVVADGGEFIRRRMIGLENFLRRILDNPVISIDPSVELFLNAVDDDAFHSAQQQQQQQLQQHQPMSTPPVVPSSTNPFRQPMGRGKPIPSEFSRTENQIQTLQDNFRKLDRLAHKLESDETSVKTEEEHLLGAFRQWLDIERKYDENDSFIETVSNAQQAIVNNHEELLKALNTKFIESINDYVLCTGVAQDVLKRRGQLSENVATSNTEQMFDQLTIANETIKADIQRWTESKDKELKDIFYSMANKKIDFYSQSVDIWEQAAAKLTPPNNKK